MHGVTESRPVTVRMEARPWRSGNKTTELGHQVGLDEIGLLMEGAQQRQGHAQPVKTGASKSSAGRDDVVAAPPQRPSVATSTEEGPASGPATSFRTTASPAGSPASARIPA